MNWKRITPKKIKNKIKSITDNKVGEIRRKYKNKTEDYKKILHIWDSAGIASLFCRELDKHDFADFTECYMTKVLMRSIHDPFDMTKYYGQESLDLEGRPFLDYAKRVAEDYGIIHIHGLFEIVPEYKKIFPKKKIVLHFHGSNLTNAKDIDELIRCTKEADRVICATPDLMDILINKGISPILILNPIDTDLFKPMHVNEMQKSDHAVYVKIRYIEMDKVKSFVANHCNWIFEIYDRDKGSDNPSAWKNTGVKFYDMPHFYAKYNRLIDVKIYPWLDGEPAQAYSKTGLEALACGLEVLNYKGEIVKGLPMEHTPRYAVTKLIGVYDGLTK